MSMFKGTDIVSLLERIDPQYREFRLLTEDQASKSIDAAKKLVMQRLGYNDAEADEFVRIKLRNDIPVLRTKEGGKFILGVARMFCDGELRDANTIGRLNGTLKLVASDAHINEYDRNLNGISAEELIRRFSKAMSDNLEKEKEEVGMMTFDGQSDYDIVRINSFEQAEMYGKFTSWCVTHYKNMFDSYTSDGINQFYFCLRKGFENVPKEVGEGCPLDSYGLSMIAVSVDENGRLNTCTCRWNHDNGGDDSIMDARQISQVVGCNFFNTFKPNNKFKERVAEAIRRVQAGERPQNVFDYAESFSDGYALVEVNEKRNWIGTDGELLSPNQWFDYAESFSDGYALVEVHEKCNWIGTDGKLLFPNQWFDYAWPFREGYAVVKLNGKGNWIGTDGKLLSPNQWFDYAESFREGYALVRLMGKTFYIGKDGYLYDRATKNRLGRPEEVAAKLNLNEAVRRAIRRYLR